MKNNGGSWWGRENEPREEMEKKVGRSHGILNKAKSNLTKFIAFGSVVISFTCV